MIMFAYSARTVYVCQNHKESQLMNAMCLIKWLDHTKHIIMFFVGLFVYLLYKAVRKMFEMFVEECQVIVPPLLLSRAQFR